MLIIDGKMVRVTFGIENTVRGRVKERQGSFLHLYPSEWDRDTEVRVVNIHQAQVIDILKEEEE